MFGHTAEEMALAEIKRLIEKHPEDERIMIHSIAQTFRVILGANPLAALAFGLVGAEMAAAP